MQEQLSLFEESLEEKIMILRGRIAVHGCAIRDLESEIKELLTQCKCEHKVKKEAYTPGDYYDRAYTTVWRQCTLCGKKFDEHKKTHSWYS